MIYDSETVKIINFFDKLPLSIFPDASTINWDDISSNLEVLQNKFKNVLFSYIRGEISAVNDNSSSLKIE
jgi:hypothetical protein